MSKIPFDADVKDLDINSREFPSNDGKPKVERIPKVEAELVTPKAKRRSGLKNAIISAEITDMKQFLVYDCLIPFAKNAFMNTLSMMLFNKPYDARSAGRSNGSRINTGGTYWSGPSRGSETLRDVSKDFLFDTKQEAIEVLNSLTDWSSKVGCTTIADFCRIAGLTPEPGDTDYGWFSLRGLRVQSYGDNYYIELPRARLL